MITKNPSSYVLNPDDIKIAAAYIERYALMHTWDNQGVLVQNDINYWAYEKFDDLVQQEPKKALALIVHILKKTENDFVLSNLAAGPLEELLRLHGPAVVDEIESIAKEESRFTTLLAQVDQVASDEIWARIKVLLPSP